MNVCGSAAGELWCHTSVEQVASAGAVLAAEQKGQWQFSFM
jgi:hypothetical protein